jgi:hypothetical protein
MISVDQQLMHPFRAGIGHGLAYNAGGISRLGPKKFMIGVGFLQVDVASFFKLALLAS